jgi:hypothetical protein
VTGTAQALELFDLSIDVSHRRFDAASEAAARAFSEISKSSQLNLDNQRAEPWIGLSAYFKHEYSQCFAGGRLGARLA